MQSLLPPAAYFDPAIFEAEQATLFSRAWQFAGFMADLAQPNDFVTTTVAGRSVLMQNFDGELRAFLNVCSHRFARIHCEPRGNGKLRCPYHGWIYDAQGIPYSIPSRPRFDDLKDRAEVAKLALKPYEVAVCGTLVFVRATTEGPTLREFLGDAWATLEAIGNALGERASREVIPFRSNWKVAVEIGLEAYHVGFVHEHTFKTLGTKGMDFTWAGRHSAWTAPVEADVQKRMHKLAGFGKMPLRLDGYLHQFVFPNLTVSTVCGTTFGFQQITPTGPGECEVTSILFVSRMEAAEHIRTTITEQLGPSSAKFASDVLHEDRGACERVQLGAPDALLQGMLSEEEERIVRFQQAWREAMTPSGAGQPAGAP